MKRFYQKMQKTLCGRENTKERRLLINSKKYLRASRQPVSWSQLTNQQQELLQIHQQLQIHQLLETHLLLQTLKEVNLSMKEEEMQMLAQEQMPVQEQQPMQWEVLTQDLNMKMAQHTLDTLIPQLFTSEMLSLTKSSVI
jgi:hypothetical protein